MHTHEAAVDNAALVRAAAGGDASSWALLVQRFSGLVWSVVRGHGLGTADAEEVYQTIWLRLAEHIGRIKEPERIGGWLVTTARHESLRARRTGQRITYTDDLEELAGGIDDLSPEQAVLDSEAAAAETERLRQVWMAFQELSGRCRELLSVLMATPPATYTEISTSFGMAIGSIGPTRARCLRRLRELLVQRGITGTPAN